MLKTTCFHRLWPVFSWPQSRATSFCKARVDARKTACDNILATEEHGPCSKAGWCALYVMLQRRVDVWPKRLGSKRRQPMLTVASGRAAAFCRSINE